MGISYFLSEHDPQLWQDPATAPPDTLPGQFVIDPFAYADALRAAWPTLTIQRPPPTLSWNLGPQGIQAFLRDAGWISFGRGYGAVAFTWWHRQYVPAAIPLYLFSSMSWDRLLLTPATTPATIQDWLGWDGPDPLWPHLWTLNGEESAHG